MTMMSMSIPAGFLTGVLQRHSRKYSLPVDHLTFRYFVLSEEYYDVYDGSKVAFDDSRFNAIKKRFGALTFETLSNAENEAAVVDDLINEVSFNDGVIISGLFSDGFRWDDSQQCMNDCLPGVMNNSMPLILMQPMMDWNSPQTCTTPPSTKRPYVPASYLPQMYKTASLTIIHTVAGGSLAMRASAIIQAQRSKFFSTSLNELRDQCTAGHEANEGLLDLQGCSSPLPTQ
ncbi:hypothetical protein HELRODRAFT_194634 [Helobdella robusta]|uniref:Dynein heavy chain C-terminal domain-containing protein n=1 Tax=Helobdella robusta TaxID=6412 RepID=T1FW92_HELRO|nr:hypothetical protein HELRODRAFT_194634 [Helobdella robusta]ESN90844.1 hypothetical protein HELRODRAFT_194634 [Helobdella robusta]